MTHKTRGIVLRTIKYGETSLVVTVFTELFGVQTYLVNGVRSAGKNNKAAMYQPAAILEMVVYHHEQKNMQRIREAKWAVLYEQVLSQVIKNCIALFMVELLYKCLKQPEQHTDLFHFCEDALLSLDRAGNTVTANFPLFFSLQLPQFLGLRIQDNYSDRKSWLDLREGHFETEQPAHPHFIGGPDARLVSQLLRVMQPEELQQFSLHQQQRRNLLHHFQQYYSLHLQEFGQLKTLRVLADVLG